MLKHVYLLLIWTFILMTLSYLDSTEAQTFQYSRGWTNGKRSYLSTLSPNSPRENAVKRAISTSESRTFRLKLPKLSMRRSEVLPNNHRMFIGRKRAAHRVPSKGLEERLSKMEAEFKNFIRHSETFRKGILSPLNGINY